MTKCLRSFLEQEHSRSGDSAVSRRRSGFHPERTWRRRLCRGAGLWNHCFCTERVSAHYTGAGAGVWDITFGPAADRADLLAIAFFVVRDKFLVSPVLSEIGNKGELINLELLVFWGIGIIKSPLPEGDISADEVNQSAVLLIKILNNRK